MKQKAKILLPLLASFLLLSCSAGGDGAQTAEIPPAVPAMGVGRVPQSTEGTPAADGSAPESPTKPETGTKTEIVLERDLLVCIDPGHGFEDGGSGASEASYYPDGTLEKDVTITVAGLLKDALEKEGFRTVMTHDGETIPQEYNWDGNDIFNPNERVALMNALDPDYIVSIHTNAAANPNAHGVQIYYDHVSYIKENDWNEPAAEMIAETIDERMGFGEEDATVLRNPVNAENGSLAITRESRAAAVLIELGFSTNEENAKNLIDSAWQADIANAIAEGVGRFFDSMGMTAKEVEQTINQQNAEGTADGLDSSDPDGGNASLSPFGAVAWRFENGKYLYDFPVRNTAGLATLGEMASFPTARIEDANKPPQVDNWFPGQVFYDESTGETTYGWDRWDSTKDIFKKIRGDLPGGREPESLLPDFRLRI